MSLDVGYPHDDDGRSYETGRVNLATLQVTLTRMEYTMNGIKQDIAYMRESNMNKNAENERRFNDQETRLRVIEAKRYLEARSFAAVFGIVFPAIAIVVSIIAIIVK